MSTKTWVSSCKSDNTANFQAWGLAISTSFADVGLVKTTDTGQIDWATAVWSNAAAIGYEIWKFNDALQATAPIFFKISYGSGSSNPSIYVEVGQGSNGVGNITGLSTGVNANSVTTTNSSAANDWPCYVNYNAVMGFFGMAAFIQNNYSSIIFMIARSCDDEGVPTGDGYTAYFRNSSFMVSYVANTILTAGANYSFVPGAIVSGAVGGETQVFKHYTAMPKIQAIPQMLTYLFAEIGALSEFAATPFGVTEHNYIALGKCTESGWAAGSNASHTVAMLWE